MIEGFAELVEELDAMTVKFVGTAVRLVRMTVRLPAVDRLPRTILELMRMQRCGNDERKAQGNDGREGTGTILVWAVCRLSFTTPSAIVLEQQALKNSCRRLNPLGL
jgi:hypothetical protein